MHPRESIGIAALHGREIHTAAAQSLAVFPDAGGQLRRRSGPPDGLEGQRRRRPAYPAVRRGVDSRIGAGVTGEKILGICVGLGTRVDQQLWENNQRL